MEAGMLYAIAAISIMLVVTASQALGAILARRDFARLAEFAEACSQSSDLDAEDKSIAASMMEVATAWYTAPLLFFAIPLVALFVPVRAVWLVLRGEKLSPENIFGKRGRATEFSSLVSSAMLKARPLLVVWMVVWALPAFVVLAVLGALRMAPDILRRSIETFLSRAAHQ
jgi:hypothetical protein